MDTRALESREGGRGRKAGREGGREGGRGREGRREGEGTADMSSHFHYKGQPIVPLHVLYMG